MLCDYLRKYSLSIMPHSYVYKKNRFLRNRYKCLVDLISSMDKYYIHFKVGMW